MANETLALVLVIFAWWTLIVVTSSTSVAAVVRLELDNIGSGAGAGGYRIYYAIWVSKSPQLCLNVEPQITSCSCSLSLTSVDET